LSSVLSLLDSRNGRAATIRRRPDILDRGKMLFATASRNSQTASAANGIAA
jgi:hypothetical protein